MMRPPYPIFLLLLGVFLFSPFLASCFKGKVKLSDDGMKARKINQMVEQIRTSYLKKDAEEIAVHFASEGAYSPEVIREKMENIFEKTVPVSLRFFIEKIVLGEQTSEVFIHWEGEWREKGKGVGRLKRGNAVFLIHGDPKPQVLDIQGDSFLYAEGTAWR